MKTQDAFNDLEECDQFFENDFEAQTHKKVVKLIDNDCAKANLTEIVKDCQHLSTDEKCSLLKLFQKLKTCLKVKQELGINLQSPFN